MRRCFMVTSRIRFTAAQKAELWERWKNGQSAAAISRALERKNKTGVERIVVRHGGIAAASRGRALAALRLEEREEISRGIAVGRSIRQIAQGLRRAPSTVSREIRRNGERMNVLRIRILVRKGSPVHSVSLDWRKTILVASQFFAFLHNLDP